MGLAEFDRIDIVASDGDGGERWITVAGSGWPVADEARPIAQFLIKLARLERHARHEERKVALELVSSDEPPICVVEIAARKAMVATVGVEARAPAKGRPTDFPNREDGWPDIDALQQANARAFARTHALPLPPTLAALDELDAILSGRRADAGLDEDEESDDAFDGDLVVLAGAYAGEAIRAQVGGVWRYEPDAAYMNPLHLAAGPDFMTRVNVLGKVIKYLTAGPADSVASLGAAVVARIGARDGE